MIFQLIVLHLDSYIETNFSSCIKNKKKSEVKKSIILYEKQSEINFHDIVNCNQ